MKKRRPISRILSWVIIYLCGLPASRMKRVTSLPTNRDSSPIWPCTGRGLPCLQVLPPEAVGSYPTFSPLPRRIRAVCFLWHFPSPHGAPCGRPTLWCSDFPPPVHRRANGGRSPSRLLSSFNFHTIRIYQNAPTGLTKDEIRHSGNFH